MKKWIAFGAAAAIALARIGAPVAIAAPTGGYAVFTQCPINAAKVNGCLYAPVEGGYITLGKTVVPIAKTLVLQAGLLREEQEFLKYLVGALDDETLTKVSLPLPGGLFGLPLYAVTELAATAGSISLNTGLGSGNILLTLPIKVRLVNHLLGAECTIGTNAHPIELNLTSGTSGGLTGNHGTESIIAEGGIDVVRSVVLVESGFAVPGANGCGSAFVDEAVDAKVGIPSNSNRIVFDSKIELANSELVEEHVG